MSEADIKAEIGRIIKMLITAKDTPTDDARRTYLNMARGELRALLVELSEMAADKSRSDPNYRNTEATE